MNRLLAVRSLVPQTRNTISTSARLQVENKVKQNQVKFQSPDGKPVHLKGGFGDWMMYTFAMGLTAVGTLWSCGSLIKMSFPKK
ncbi:cytochrome c oxidase subunit 7A2, mitochondrial-like [Diadema setosum]|uniref:cytochrome c oxidase subunit 7A2, mitochondrial-like n=1 Tax=Diadema setosum TaxID=31175 RepID=UPI003B3A7CB2